jgi:hypothetical protein
MNQHISKRPKAELILKLTTPVIKLFDAVTRASASARLVYKSESHAFRFVAPFETKRRIIELKHNELSVRP